MKDSLPLAPLITVLISRPCGGGCHRWSPQGHFSSSGVLLLNALGFVIDEVLSLK